MASTNPQLLHPKGWLVDPNHPLELILLDNPAKFLWITKDMVPVDVSDDDEDFDFDDFDGEEDFEEPLRVGIYWDGPKTKIRTIRRLELHWSIYSDGESKVRFRQRRGRYQKIQPGWADDWERQRFNGCWRWCKLAIVPWDMVIWGDCFSP